VSEAIAVEAASGLAAIAALVQGLGSFLSPYLPDILAVVLGPQVGTGCTLVHEQQLSPPSFEPHRSLKTHRAEPLAERGASMQR